MCTHRFYSIRLSLCKLQKLRPWLENAEVIQCSRIRVCVDDRESWRKLDGEVGVESDRVKVEQRNVQSGGVLLDQGEIGGLNRRSDEDECVGSKDLVLREEGL
jgi:hypothetical protein